MAKKSLRIKTARLQANLQKSLAKGEKPKFSTKVYNRCRLCGRNRGYMRRFDMCRICFRENAIAGFIPGVKKCSW
ncbi:MAG: type Z 30S ribosomal protein S14 [Patescibacteria group bacterium]